MDPSRARRPRAIAVVVAVAIALTACDGSEGTVSAGAPATNATVTSLLPTTVSGLPSFDFGTFEQLLYQLRGTPVVVNIWASWCGPCRDEAPVLVDGAQRYGDRLQFLGVDYQDSRDAAASYLREFGVPYPSVFDAHGEIHDQLGFVGLPDTVFYAADGQIASTWSGPLTAEALTDHLSLLLDGTTSGGAATEAAT